MVVLKLLREKLEIVSAQESALLDLLNFFLYLFIVPFSDPFCKSLLPTIIQMDILIVCAALSGQVVNATDHDIEPTFEVVQAKQAEIPILDLHVVVEHQKHAIALTPEDAVNVAVVICIPRRAKDFW